MPTLGMTGRWPGFAGPLTALLVTLSLTWLTAQVVQGGDDSEAVSGLVFLILLPAPLVVAVVWGGALLTGRPYRLAPAAAVIWAAVSWALAPHDVVWQMLGPVAAGLLAGLALGMRWRLDAALLVVVLALSPILLWTTFEVPVEEQFQILSDEMLKTLEYDLPAGADETQRTAAMAKERRKLEQLTGLAIKAYPFFLAVGVLGQAGIILALLWLVVRGLGLEPHGWSLPPFSRWRVPFYVVWVLVIGLGLVLTRRPGLANAGMNLALLAACVLSVQGIAVQFHVTGRMMSMTGRVFYWSVMGFFFGFLIMGSGIVLGLIDQWWDIRRLRSEVSADAGENDIGEDDDND